MSKNTINQKERFDIYEFLKTVIKVLPFKTDKGEPRCDYHADWDDQKVAEKFNTSPAVVSGIRRNAFGHIRGGETRASIESRLDAIEYYLTQLDPNWREKEPAQPELLKE
jgi:hypothetical protein